MTERDDRFDDVAALALGILPAQEARRVRMQIALDEQLFAEYQAYRSVADMVGFAAEVEPGGIHDVQCTRMKANVMNAVRARAADRRAVPAQRRRLLAWPAYALAAAALVAAIVAGIDDAALRSDLAAQRGQTTVLRQQVADLFAPDSRHYAVKGGEVVVRDGRIYLAMRSLPKLPPGKVFQAWTLATGAKAVAPSVTFVPDQSGSAIVRLPAQPRPLAAVAISIEPAGGSKAPTSTPTFIRPLT